MASEHIRLMIVDDQRLFREGIKSLLKTHDGIEVVAEAEEGQQAVEMAPDCAPDVILLDLNMPGIDGIETCRLLKSELPSSRIVILTVSKELASIVSAVKAGASGYLTKSATHVEIIRALRVVTDGGHYLQDCVHSAVVRAMRARARRSESGLSEREEEVLALVARGLTNTSIATELHISLGTVKSHLTNIYRKLEVADRTRAVVEASNRGWLHP